ncbi:hypothetical protein I5677_16970 [Mobilitalea sibirica]|uniref:Uncharacterized protein n=1 Tax=Mobilitalea sibirica TaxID=1462919 RepID=A0A8J7H6L4_9FIRM|nr:hypothetical protein [Mobilitalea sibirica]MBH1942584.1 hypothetical protein [Mobilitalea sibirica]
MKKIYIIIILIVVLIIGYNVYKAELHTEGKEYLLRKYPENTFEMGSLNLRYAWLGTLDFFTVIDVYCEDNNVEFDLVFNKGNISDGFIDSLNEKKKDELVHFVKLLIKEEEWFKDININIIPQVSDDIYKEDNVKSEEVYYSMSVIFSDIKTDINFAEESHAIINTLRQKKIKVSSILLYYGNKDGEYELELTSDDLYLSKNDILRRIKRKKHI